VSRQRARRCRSRDLGNKRRDTEIVRLHDFVQIFSVETAPPRQLAYDIHFNTPLGDRHFDGEARRDGQAPFGVFCRKSRHPGIQTPSEIQSSQENCAQDVGSVSFWALPRRTSRERIIRSVSDLRLQPAAMRLVHTTASRPRARRRCKTPPSSRDIGYITPRRCEAR